MSDVLSCNCFSKFFFFDCVHRTEVQRAIFKSGLALELGSYFASHIQAKGEWGGGGGVR